MKMLSKKSATILGVTLEGGVLTAVEVRRTNGSVHILKRITEQLTLDPLKDEPDLVGREIRLRLTAIRPAVRQ